MTDEELIEQVARVVGQKIEGASEDMDSVWYRQPLWKAYTEEARAILPIMKAERIRGGEMVKEAAAITAFGSLNVVDAGDRIRALSVPAIVEAGDA